jgi:hypothetical protein
MSLRFLQEESESGDIFSFVSRGNGIKAVYGLEQNGRYFRNPRKADK